MQFDNQAILTRFQGMVQIPTLSSADPAKVDLAPFLAFHKYLEETYPLVHRHLTREVVEGGSLLYHWKGTGASQLLPLALMAHMDVVPVGDVSRWSHPPFGGEIAGGYIWGRGTLDTKCLIVAQMEAVEALLGEGYAPSYDVYLCYGHNEEAVAKGQKSGAKAIVELLSGRGIRLGCVIDEGGSIVSGSVLGLDRRVGVIGLAEKGSADFELSVTDEGGHSSQPKGYTALSRLARALVELEENPMPTHLLQSVDGTLGAVAPYMKGIAGKALAKREKLWPVVAKVLSARPATNAMIRTTIAATMATGSAQANILPERATATVNCRILPGDSIRKVGNYIARTVGKDVRVRLIKGSEPSPESRTDGPFRLLQRTAEELFPDALITSYLMLGGSDARHYYPISDHVYRFAPFYFDEEALPTAHAVNERMPSDGFGVAAQFFAKVIEGYGAEKID